mmetsp:Transcript_5474/g.13493  ORF Transcript_5474/g.13493 Transcript_5474/m.13493 type:complete len:318 (-) Transcript_5474:676-1629(-)
MDGWMAGCIRVVSCRAGSFHFILSPIRFRLSVCLFVDWIGLDSIELNWIDSFSFRGPSEVPPDVVPAELGLGRTQQDGSLPDLVFAHDVAEFAHDVHRDLSGLSVFGGAALDVLVGLGQNDHVGNVRWQVLPHLFHDVAVLVDGPVPGVDQVEDDLEVFAVLEVFSHEGGPLLLLFVRHLGESESRQVHQVKAVVVLLSLHGVPVPDLLFSAGLVVDGKKVEFLRLARGFAGVGKGFAVGDHVDQARFPHVGSSDKDGFSPVGRRKPGHVHGPGHKEHPADQTIRQGLVDPVVVVGGKGAHGTEHAVGQVAGELDVE